MECSLAADSAPRSSVLPRRCRQSKCADGVWGLVRPSDLICPLSVSVRNILRVYRAEESESQSQNMLGKFFTMHSTSKKARKGLTPGRVFIENLGY